MAVTPIFKFTLEPRLIGSDQTYQLILKINVASSKPSSLLQDANITISIFRIEYAPSLYKVLVDNPFFLD